MKQILAILTILSISIFLSCNSNAQKTEKLDWLLIYCMPYDNNLSEFGTEILNMIKKGVVSPEVAVVVQADYADTSGMKRYLINSKGIEESKTTTERSADVSVFNEYLNWVTSKYHAENYGIIFLDHGGRLNELCQDEYPENKFLKIDSIKSAILDFNKRTSNKTELIFMQVCAKGVLEPVYELKNCAEYTLCSQNVMGAPNYYYESVLKDLSTQKISSGKELAESIVKNERNNMYYSFTCVNNHKMDSLKLLFNDFIDICYEHENLNLSTWELEEIDYYEQKYWDLVTFLKAIKTDNELLKNKRKQLIKFIKEELIVFHYINPSNNKMDDYSGLSIFGKNNSLYAANYNYLDFYNDIQLKQLMLKIKIKD